MKILQVIHGFHPYNVAGTEVYTYNLCQELAKKHKLAVFYRVDDLDLKEYTIKYNKLDILDIFTINNTFRLYNSFEMTYRNDAIAEKFGWVLDQSKPDIIHIQHLLYLSTKIVEETIKRRIPMVFTLHDYWLICPQGQLLKNSMYPCNGEDNFECINCILYQLSIKEHAISAYYFLKNFVPEYFVQLFKNIYLGYSKASFLTKKKALNLIEERITHMKNICSEVDLFISPSQFLRRKFIEFGIPKDKIIILPYGFNLNNFKNFKKTSSDKLRFGFIGNLLLAKGVHILIESFNKIKNDSVELRIYGRVMSYKGMLCNYLRYIKKITKNKNIKFMGDFDYKRIAEIFGQIDVLVVPSIWYENSPLVIQEAFATKTPVIASNVGGIPELIKDGINGFLFEPNNSEDLYRKINLIIENPNLLGEIRQNIKPPKSIEENAKEIEEIYNKLIDISISKSCCLLQA